MKAEELLELWSECCRKSNECYQCFCKDVCRFPEQLTKEKILLFLELAEEKFRKTKDHFPTENAEDPVNHPPHYETGKFECFDVMRKVFGYGAVSDFCLLNAFKYLYRCEHRGKKTEDVENAVWYLTRWLELNNQE